MFVTPLTTVLLFHLKKNMMENDIENICEIKVEIVPIDEHQHAPNDENDQNINDPLNTEISQLLADNGNEIQRTKKQFQCEICNKAFPTESKLNRHVSGVHFKLKNHPCHLCEKKFSENHHLKQHVDMVHHGIKNFACEICEKLFARTQDLKNHRLNVHGKTADPSKKVENDSIVPTCKLCKKTFANKSALKGHLALVHFGVKEHKCQKCEKSYSRTNDLKAHLLKVHDEGVPQDPEELSKARKKCHICSTG